MFREGNRLDSWIRLLLGFIFFIGLWVGLFFPLEFRSIFNFGLSHHIWIGFHLYISPRGFACHLIYGVENRLFSVFFFLSFFFYFLLFKPLSVKLLYFSLTNQHKIIREYIIVFLERKKKKKNLSFHLFDVWIKSPTFQK